jgi:uncharacterized protein YyaL (SSP411 family)
VLTSWNALMAKGMARAGRIFGEPIWIDSARGSLDFIRSTLWRDGRLLATYKEGRAHLNAYLDDHAFLLDALLELMQSDFRGQDLEFARTIADLLLEHFEDRDHGGFFFVSHDHETLIHRPKTGHDGASPSGNGVAALALQRLGHILGETRYLTAAQRTVELYFEAMQRNASSHTTLTTALEESLAPPRIVVLRGRVEAMRTWQSALAEAYRPETMVLAIPGDASGLPPVLDKPADANGPVAWVCQGTACLAPIRDLPELMATLSRDDAGER